MDKNFLADAYFMQRFGKTSKDVNVQEVLEAIREVSQDLYEQTEIQKFRSISNLAEVFIRREEQ